MLGKKYMLLLMSAILLYIVYRFVIGMESQQYR